MPDAEGNEKVIQKVQIKPVLHALLFYVLIPGAASYFLSLHTGGLEQSAEALIVSIFSIIGGLLFASQFALFSIAAGIDAEKVKLELGNRANFKKQLRGINRAIAQLVLFSVLLVVCAFVTFSAAFPRFFESFLLLFAMFAVVIRLFFTMRLTYQVLDMGYRNL